MNNIMNSIFISLLKPKILLFSPKNHNIHDFLSKSSIKVEKAATLKGYRQLICENVCKSPLHKVILKDFLPG